MKEFIEILKENPAKFFELGFFKEICLNSLTNKLKSFLGVFKSLRENNEKIVNSEIYKGLIDLSLFNFQYKLTLIGIATNHYRKFFLYFISFVFILKLKN